MNFKHLLVSSTIAFIATASNAGVIMSEYSKVDGPMSITTNVVNPVTSFTFVNSISRDTSNQKNLNISFVSGPTSFNLLSLSNSIVTSDISDINGHIGTIVWNNQSNNGILSGSIDPTFSSTPFSTFLSDFTSSGYDMSLTIKDINNKTTTIQSINAAFGFSPSYDWNAVNANSLTLQELLLSPQTCGSTGCANLTKVSGFSATLSPFDFTANTVPEPAGLALMGLGAIGIAFRRNK